MNMEFRSWNIGKIHFAVIVIVLLGFGCSSVDVLPVPHPEPAKDLLLEDPNIILDYPVEGGVVSSPLTIRGSARTFENTVEWRVTDLYGVELASGFTTADSPDVGEFGDFSTRVFLPPIEDVTFYLEVFETSPRDGAEESKVKVEVIPEEKGKTTVQVFFIDEAPVFDGLPAGIDFDKRTTHKTMNVAEFAILELLKGSESGWASQYIPMETFLNRIEIRAGKASVYFDNTWLPDWCTGVEIETGRREQINATLTQFPTVTDVDVYINEKLFDCVHS